MEGEEKEELRDDPDREVPIIFRIRYSTCHLALSARSNRSTQGGESPINPSRPPEQAIAFFVSYIARRR